MWGSENLRRRVFVRLGSHLAITLLILAALGSAAKAQDERKRVLDQLERAKFAHWKSIGIFCTLDPADQTAQDLCEWTTQKVRLLGAQSRIAVEVMNNDAFQRGYDDVVKKPRDVLELELRVLATPAGGSPVGAAVRLIASADAQEWKATDKDDARAKARPGTLVLFDKSFILSGATRGPALDAALRRN